MYTTKLDNGEQILIKKLLNVNEGVAYNRILLLLLLIFLHGLGRLTCSGIDAFPYFPATYHDLFSLGVCS
jgi:hypothetical protein